MHYKLNQPDVVQETVEGETLIVHTRSGTYYNLEGCGTLVWNSLLAGRSVAAIGASFDSGDEAASSSIRSGLDAFVEALLAEQLILPAEGEGNPSSEITGTQKPAFVAPELKKFTDMEELLLVDPIHEVNPEAGWPLQKDSEKTA
ncbi:MAG: PqqD family peptide modification chaperone [Akkermansiaceae bacterium]